MTTEQITEKVKDIIVDKLGIKREEIGLQSSFTTDLGADSLDQVELIMDFEKQFNIGIDDSVAEQITTVQEAVTKIDNTINKK